MAARMESTGARNRIHVSADTANLLKSAGKSNWIEKRRESIDVKGKGRQETYWVKISSKSASSTRSESTDSECALVEDPSSKLRVLETQAGDKAGTPLAGSMRPTTLSKKVGRLVEWNVAVLKQRLVAIQVQRNGTDKIDDKVEQQLKQHVSGIASMYRTNAFHNFEHCSHITMAVTKMLSRVKGDESATGTLVEEEFTRDITSDPLTQFAVIYAALIHDVDHTGASNDQLIKEGAEIATIYENKSVAENHSFNLSWTYLVGSDFKDLVECITGGIPSERDRLFTLVLKAVLATDVFDKDLKADREKRWASVFSTGNDTDPAEKNKLKAQIVLEHLIQAADVSHTMQHWHIYVKWNERLFVEMTDAYKAGRLAKNPADFWYQGEIGFFDFYVIPLAKKIGDCGVFGISSDEFLTYAKENRKEWERKGREVVEGFKKKYSPE